MRVIECLYAFKLNYYFIFNDQIGFETNIEPVSPVFKCNWCLSLDI